MHVQNMGMLQNGSHGVQQRSANLESTLREGDIGETVVQNAHLNQVTIYLFALLFVLPMKLYPIMAIFAMMNHFKIYYFTTSSVT